MRERGFFLQGWCRPGAGNPVYCCTVGLQRLPVPRPEVIVFRLDICCAAPVLRRVYERVRVDGPLPPGAVVAGLFDPACVRIDEVHDDDDVPGLPQAGHGDGCVA